MLADPSFPQGCVTDNALCINSEHTEASADTQQENTRGILPTGRFHIFLQTIDFIKNIFHLKILKMTLIILYSCINVTLVFALEFI